MKRVFLLLVLALVLAGCVQQPSNGDSQNFTPNTTDAGDGTDTGDSLNTGGDDSVDIVEKGDKVKVEYVGKFPDGEVFDKSEGRGPLEFVAGAGQMIQGFDEAVIGMKLDEEKNVTIPPEKAYGTADSGQKVEVPLANIDGNENLEVGATLYSTTGQQGTIVEIKEGIATVEFKHPLAGKALEFWIKVVGIEKAGSSA